MKLLKRLFAGPTVDLHRKDPEARYRQAHAAHWDAVERGDTRAMHDTRAELLAAQTERLMGEVWG